ncbi:sugar phosphate nucleotidyltransferase [Methanobacterium paludis]|uniref:Bifunctional protein GlmU n=1 Tax=Methanobacterium paludis (strain DSM 25820 / JCM 18151 / SWAN1) TaxID=868131 RepID=F6D8B8_METPW|nr:NDP-sugar synthase [Methanobacterium paludis]AEG18552.1 Mannose-1-phosphate guanylyltransferase [Methanobacterium paludis]
MVKAIIMAGGKGTRLRPLTFIRPKPMIPLVNRPIIQHTVERLKLFGLKDVIMTLNYMSGNVKSYFKNGSNMGVNIDYSVERSPLGTGGSVRKAKKYVDKTFLVLSGDVISNINFKDILKFHKEKGAIATLVLTKVDDPSHFGIAVLDEGAKITNYLEKPAPSEVFSKIANTGIYVFEPEIFDFFEDKKGEVDFSNEIFPKLIEENAGIYGYVFDGYWNDVGRPESYLKATYDILNQKVKQTIYKAMIKPGIGKIGNIWTGKNIHMGKRVRIEGPVVIGSNCIIDDGSTISKGSVIGDNVFIGKNTNIQGSVILKDSVIKENSFLSGCIIDTKCRIEKNSIIEDGVVAGSRVRIGENSVVKSSRHIKNRIKILPDSIIDADLSVE